MADPFSRAALESVTASNDDEGVRPWPMYVNGKKMGCAATLEQSDRRLVFEGTELFEVPWAYLGVPKTFEFSWWGASRDTAHSADVFFVGVRREGIALAELQFFSMNPERTFLVQIVRQVQHG